MHDVLIENVKVEGNFWHPSVKPLHALIKLVLVNTKERDLILDPFVGSGTTCVAAKMLRRHYIGIEKELKYCEIAKARLANVPPPLESFVEKEMEK